MKQKFLKSLLVVCVAATVFIGSFESCNKAIPSAVPITTVQNSLTINSFLTTDTTFSLFNAAMVKAGLTSLLSDTTADFTLFAANNATMRPFLAALSGGALCACSSNATFTTFINGLSAAQIVPIMSYLIIPGKEFVYTDYPTTFPNIQLPSYLTIGTLPGTTIPLKLSVFPSRRTTGFWLNTSPVVTFDAHYRNGVVHILGSVPLPPSATLKTMINSDPNATFFSAAVIRGDSGQVGLNRIDSLLNYAVTNMTVFVPNDNAFKAVLYAQIYNALIAQGVPSATAQAQATALSSSPTVFSNPALYAYLPATLVRGIVVYHFIAQLIPGAGYQPTQRAFSVNFPTTPAPYTTLVNNVVALHPGITVQSFFNTAGTAVDSMKVKGYANATPSTAKPASNFDKHAVNGVYHLIDQVLLPQ